MKKFFLIPVLALFTCVSAWGTVHTAGTIDELTSALAAAVDGDEIQLTADINYGYPSTAGVINITKSITLNGQGHTLTGASSRPDGQTSQWATIWVNPSSMVDATVKNITIVNAYSNTGRYVFAIQTRKNINSLTIEDAVLDIRNGGRGNSAPFQMGGSDTNLANITLKNSKFLAKNSDYPFLTWVPANVTAINSYFNGYCGLYFKAGSAGSVVNADACDFDAPNVHDFAGGWNNFGVFAQEDANITINLHNCGMNAQEIGFANQGMILPQQVGFIVNISGDNSHINGRMVLENANYPGYYLALLELTGGLTITGGTYSVDPSHYGPYNPYTWFGDQDPTLPDEDLYANFVPNGYEVQEVKQGNITLYRVVKKAQEKEPGVMYDLNDYVPVEGEGYGDNPVTSFDLSTGTEMELNQETTTAGYVQVSDNGDDATIIKVGKVEDAGTPEETKVDQTLVINNGLDVQGESQVIVQAGSTVQIGEGGINTEQPSNIVIEADENGAASLIMDPTITVNQTPNLTVKMKAKQIGWINMLDDKYRFWHRFALPIQEAASWVKIPNKSTYVFGWNYSTNDWEQLSALTQMEPFKGYTLTADYENLGNVEYTFTGQLAGNTNNSLAFERNGFNFFGNSYTGYIDILALVDQIMGDAKIDGTVWVWNQDNQSYVAIPLEALRANPDAFDPWMREVAPMQTFIMKQNGSENATTELNYASAVWGNPRYNTSAAAPAPRRAVADETTRMRIIVTAENGKSDFIMLTEDAQFTDAFEKGYDGEKYMNENTLNMYATIDGTDYTAVATDNLEGKTVTINTVEAVNYTMSFAKVNGEEYAIRDNVTGAMVAIEEGATYEFAAQPNSTVEGRFEIVPVAKMPTAIENTEVKANVKGIYTIMGQYLGENFDILPTGIYVVNGVKIVK